MNTELEMICFTAADRCDRCIGQAYHLARKSKMELLMCNHHHNEHREPLLAGGWEIISDQEAVDNLVAVPG